MLVCIWIWFLMAVTPTRCSNMTVGEFLEQALDPAVYNKRLRPGANQGIPTEVDIDMQLNSISSIDQGNMDFTVDVFLRLRWREPRLAYTMFNHTITMDYSHADRIWLPDLFFYNEKMAMFHDVMTPNLYYRLWPDGRIMYSVRISSKFACFMNIERYPMDDQNCTIRMESYGYTTSEIKFRWRDIPDPIQVDPEIQIPEFLVDKVSHSDCTQKYVTGEFTCLSGIIYFKRRVSIYLLNTYIPSVLSVVMSWVSFWIDSRAVPARTTIGLLTVLTVTTQTTYILTQLPKVNYVKAIDVWMVCCLVFVFVAFLEFAAVNVLDQKLFLKQMKITKSKQPKARSKETEIVDQFNDISERGYISEMSHYEDRTHHLNAKMTNSHQEEQNNTSAQIHQRNGQKSATKTSTKFDISDSPNLTFPNMPTVETVFSNMGEESNGWRNFRGIHIDNASKLLFPVSFGLFSLVYWLAYRST